MIVKPAWTPTQTRILQLLSDGMKHRQKELLRIIDGEYASVATLHMHISLMRPKLRPIGEEIFVERTSDGTLYQHVRIISIAE